MPYAFKLAHRLSRLRDAGMICVLAVVAACETTRSVSVVTPTISTVVVSPDSVTLTPGQTSQFSAYGLTAAGDSLPVSVTWTASGGAISSTGLFTAGSSVGTFTVDAQSGALHGHGQGHVKPGSVANVAVSPTSATDSVGAGAQFTATLTDAAGNLITGATVTWSSTNTSAVTVSATGYATAVAPGSGAVVATSQGKSGQAQITVNGSSGPGPVASVTVSPAAATISVGGTQAFSAVLKDAAGNVTSGPVTWSSSAPTIAGISVSGLVTGLLAGTSTITATSGTVSGTGNVTVSALPPPPPSGWPDEPSGWTTLAEHSGDVLTPTGWSVEWNDSGYLTPGLDASAPMSPPGVLQYKWPIGWTNLIGMGALYHDFPATKRVFVGTWWKPSNPWQGHVSNTNKIQYLFTSSSGSIFMAMYGPPGGPYQIVVFPQFTTSLDRWLTPNVNQVNVTLGQWHRLEWLVDYSGTKGHIQWWMDGVLLGDYNDDPPPPEGIMEYKLHPVWGGAETTPKTETDYYWFDQVHVSGN